MKLTLAILILSFFSPACFAQTVAELQKITAFKNNYLRKVKLNQPDTLRLDSLIMVREKYAEYRIIKTFRKHKNVVLHESYYNKSYQIKSIKTYDSTGRPIGIAKNFTRKGILESLQDHDKGKWIVYEKKNYPFYDLQSTMKVKADSLISKMYGYRFLIDHTTWSVDRSYISIDRVRKKWKDELKETPKRFSFCYVVRLDSQNNYTSFIYFDLDSTGNFLPNYQGGGFFFEGSGFENVADSLKGHFNFNYAAALSKAKSLGLLETDSAKASGQLFWEDFRERKIYNGQFRFYISIRTKVIENLSATGRSSKTTKYDTYSFSPWTGNFIEVKKMKTYQWWEKERSGFTLLQPDKE